MWAGGFGGPGALVTLSLSLFSLGQNPLLVEPGPRPGTGAPRRVSPASCVGSLVSWERGREGGVTRCLGSTVSNDMDVLRLEDVNNSDKRDGGLLRRNRQEIRQNDRRGNRVTREAKIKR